MSVAAKIVNRPVLGLVIFGLVAVVALFLVSGIPLDMFPDINPPFLLVMTTYRGAGPETVEKTVTRILESQLVNISGLEKITSTSSEEQSFIFMEFKFGDNLDAKTNDLRDRLDRVKSMLPDESDTPFILKIDPNSQPILRIAVQGNRSNNALQAIATDIILDRLEQVNGVASTEVIGGEDQQVRVEISQNRLEAYGLSITGVAGMLAAQNLELGAGSIVDGSKNYSIRTIGEYRSVQDIAETVITRRGEADIRLIDIGEVRLGYPKETSAAYINGESGIFVTVTKQSGTNSVAVADQVYKKLDDIKPLLPQDVSLKIVQDNTTQIRDMINELVNSALMGAILAMLILFLFLRNIKATVIIGISIPFSILVTLLLMSLTGLTLNMLTLAGLILGIGMIVDCSIVILENIFKYRERGTKPDISAILGSQEVMVSIISSTLTTLSVFTPIVLFKNRLGFIGIMVQDLIITIGVSLTSSLLIAIFLVPILASKYLPLYTRAQKPLRNKALIMIDTVIEKGINAITKGYTRLLAVAVKHRMLTTILVIVVFIGSVFTIPRLRIVLMPPMNEDSFTLNMQLPLGTIYEDSKATALQLQSLVIDEIKGIKTVVTTIEESSQSGMFGSSGGQGSIVVTLDMNMPGAYTSEQAKNRLRAHFGDFPNAELSFNQGMGGMMGGSDIDLALKIHDISPGFTTAQEIKELIEENVPELIEVSIDMTEGLPQVEVIIDRNRAYNLGLSVSAIAREIAAAMNGVTATVFRFEGSEYSVVLELREEDREKLPDLGRIFVASNTGNLIPLSNFATLEKGMGPVNVKRENQSRIIHITGSLATRGRVFEVEQKIRGLLDTEYILPEGLSLLYEGQSMEITKTIQAFISILILAVLLVFGVMAGLYESFKDPFINLFTIPLMLIGVVSIHFITGQTLSMFSLIGLVMLVGIVVNNGIILVDYTNLLVGRGVPIRQACMEAGESRLRPVLMTMLTTILGLIPLAFFPGKSAAFIQPIGLTVIGGLFSSTFITLFFIPVLYSLFNEKRKKQKTINAEPQLKETL
ncbi:MAG: efflux RND transporter permease subunit [Treponema sp.]|jgi:HAE1 family hydrophobic/amphiphilic exporter-1|nr:efflux RND transporter permease subunit [Treponema sp.]